MATLLFVPPYGVLPCTALKPNRFLLKQKRWIILILRSICFSCKSYLAFVHLCLCFPNTTTPAYCIVSQFFLYGLPSVSANCKKICMICQSTPFPQAFWELLLPIKVEGMLVVLALPTKVVGMQAVYQSSQIQEQKGSNIVLSDQFKLMKTLAVHFPWNRGTSNINKDPRIRGPDHNSRESTLIGLQ